MGLMKRAHGSGKELSATYGDVWKKTDDYAGAVRALSGRGIMEEEQGKLVRYSRSWPAYDPNWRAKKKPRS